MDNIISKVENALFFFILSPSFLGNYIIFYYIMSNKKTNIL